MFTVNFSPSTKPVTVGFLAVALLNTADPSVVHDQETASPPVSFNETLVTLEHTGPLLLAVAVGANWIKLPIKSFNSDWAEDPELLVLTKTVLIGRQGSTPIIPRIAVKSTAPSAHWFGT